MDDSLDTFEAELKKLRPVAPSPALRERVRAELARPARRTSLWWMAAALPIAASITLVSVLSRRNAVPQDGSIDQAPVVATMPSTGVLRPVSVENVLYSAADEGVVLLEDGTRARRARLHYVDTVRWQNPETRASLTWTVPREEVRVIPVRYQ